MNSLFAVIAGGLLAGCVETPKPVMRPIPPPPSTPPPGVVYVPPNTAMITNYAVPTITPNGNFEVSSNFVGSVQSPAPNGASGQVVQTAPLQYEIVPPRPGPGYVWHDGTWQWNNGWMWVPGEWVYRPGPPVIIVQPGYYYGPRHYYYRRW
jgi:hypothetical protein